jgi:glycosyltransferase involved in cell wall biosynthesis
MAMALLAKRFSDCKLVFDIRGLMADEYVDAGIWREGSLVFRIIKWLEKTGARRADQIVVLTERMRDWLIEKNLAKDECIEVIPCCADFSKYGWDDHDQSHSKSDRFEIVYAGSVTGLYLLEEIGKFFLKMRETRKDAFLRILTTSPASGVVARLQKAGLAQEDVWVGAVKPSEVPGYLYRASLGVSFRKPTFSQIAASPTKIPEYLASGLPVICNTGIGDTDELISKERVGVVINGFTDADYRQALRQLEEIFNQPELAHRCREVARKYFDLDQVGGARYRLLYQRLL